MTDPDLLLARLAVACCYREIGTKAAIICGAWDDGTSIDIALHAIRIGRAMTKQEPIEAERKN